MEKGSTLCTYKRGMDLEGETTLMWNQMADLVRRVAKEVHGESTVKIYFDKETSWWSVEIQEGIREKRRWCKV